MAANIPTANSSESPGRIGVTTSPVSQKMISKQHHIGPHAILGDDLAQVLVEVQEKVDES